MRHFTILFLLWHFCALCHAADNDKISPDILPYGYNNTVEGGFGIMSGNLKSYDNMEDKGIALFGKGDGISFRPSVSLRYSRFLTRHWGAFFQFKFESDRRSPYALVDYYADRQPGVYEYDSWWKIGTANSVLMLGAVYRHDFGRWSLRPRIGAGVGELGNSYVFFSRIEEIDQVTVLQHRYKFMLSDSNGNDKDYPHVFSYGTSLQLTYTPRCHLFFFVEGDWTGTIGHVYQKVTSEDYKVRSAFKDTQFYREFEEPIEGSLTTHLTRVSAGHRLSFRLGAGWNIGWNRNCK